MIVERIPTNTADAIGQNPCKIIGISIKKIRHIVEIIEIMLVAPFFFPIKRSRMKNIAVKA